MLQTRATPGGDRVNYSLLISWQRNIPLAPNQQAHYICPILNLCCAVLSNYRATIVATDSNKPQFLYDSRSCIYTIMANAAENTARSRRRHFDKHRYAVELDGVTLNKLTAIVRKNRIDVRETGVDVSDYNYRIRPN